MKPSPNMICPCGSKLKYKKCCQPFHNGKLPNSALLLMKSRYSAYSLGLLKYIIKTTHNENSDFSEDLEIWGNDIKEFCKNTNFLGLKILDFRDGQDMAFVTFEASLTSNNENIGFIEKSKFYKVSNIWLYHSGEFL
ncbi:MAG: SEC-C domain-containing protein [Arcobacter sp.]|nr:SEC-C domain-containing protein [Arcobacter sp.]